MFKSLLDKLFFTCGAIVFLQLPHFIEQYTQRMGGYASSQSEQINEYQNLADQHFNGDLTAYILRLEQNTDPAIAESAQQISQRIRKTQNINNELRVFELEPLWYQVPYFITHMRMDLVHGTAQNFAPGLPINLWAWGYGLIGGVLFSLIFNALVLIPSKMIKSKQAALRKV